MNERVRRAREDQGGFTLIELMIVIIILGVLAGIVIFSVRGITDRGNAAACKTDLGSISTAVEAFRTQTGAYPAHLVPDLTDPALGTPAGSQVFLRWDSGFTASTDATGPASDVHDGNGWTITYHPTTGGGFTEGDVSATGC